MSVRFVAVALSIALLQSENTSIVVEELVRVDTIHRTIHPSVRSISSIEYAVQHLASSPFTILIIISDGESTS
jgi:hypothetical protein